MENKTLTLGSLFSGSGGFELAGIIAGIEPVFNSEIEPFAIRVTTKRLPKVKHYGDVSSLSGADLPPVDIITFGSPCQDMSIAGKRDGLDGSRSSLFYEAIRIVKEMREKTNGEKPRFIVWENVPGAFSSNKGQDFKAVLEAVIGVKEPAAEVPPPEKGKWPNADYYVGDGWSVGYRVLDAQWWGVPQRRARIFLVADFAGECAKEILFESEGMSGYSAESFRSWQRAAGNPTESPGETGSAGFDGYNGSLTGEVSATLGVNCGMSTGRNGIVLNDQGGNRMDVTEEVTCTLRAEAHHPPIVMDDADNSGDADSADNADEPQAFHINQRDEGIDLHGVSGALMATRNNQMQTFVVEKMNAPDAAGFCTEHSAKARSIGYEEEKSPTLRAGVVPAAMTKEVIPLEHHPTDSRIGIEEGNAIQTLTSRMGTGGNNVPLIMTPDGPLVPKTLKIRSGCKGGGKGALIQEDVSATLGTSNDQTVFVPAKEQHMADEGGENCIGQPALSLDCRNLNENEEVSGTLQAKNNGGYSLNYINPVAFGISSMESNGMKSDNPNVGFYKADTSKTLDVSGGNPSCRQGGIAVVAIEGNGTRPSHKGDGYKQTDAMYTLNATEQHSVAYGIDRAAFNQGQNAKFGFQVEEEVEPTMVSRGPNAVAHPSFSASKASFFTEAAEEKANTLVASDYKDPPIVNDSAYGFYPQQKAEGMAVTEEVSGTLVNGTNPGYQNGVIEPYYIVRRLTPVECARLQGFPDWWCSDLAIEEPTEEDISFWRDVWETHRKVVSGSSKPKSDKQLIKWLKDPHSDAAEYKLWGNGVALPCVYFVLSGIVWAAQKGK